MQKTTGFAALVVAMAACAVHAATYYVRPDGDDNNAGDTPETALATPRAGFAKVNKQAGAELVIYSGTYNLSSQGGAIGCTGGSSEAGRVVVLDLMLGDMDGADAIAGVRGAAPSAKILVLTTFGTAAELSRAVAAGAVGAVTKNISSTELAAAIRDTAAGVAHFSPEIRQTLDEIAGAPRLTRRQREILSSVVRGLTNDDIARQIGFSKSLVKMHLAEIYEIIGAANRAEAVAIALKRKIV